MIHPTPPPIRAPAVGREHMPRVMGDSRWVGLGRPQPIGPALKARLGLGSHSHSSGKGEDEDETGGGVGGAELLVGACEAGSIFACVF